MELPFLFPSRAILAAIFLGLFGICQPEALAQRDFYRFTVIADTQGGFPYQSLTLFPCQNNADSVGFDAVLTGGVQGMFVRHDLGGVNSIADTGTSPYEEIADCSINGNGLVLFSALQHLPNEFAQVLLLGGGNPLLTLLTAKADGTFKFFGGYQLNQQGKAVTEADKADGSGSVILTNGPLTGLTHIIADTSQRNSPFVNVGTSPSINAHNTVAFTALQRSGPIAIITIADDGTETILIDSTGPFAGFGDIDLNDNGSLAFDGHQQGGLGGVWRLDPSSSGSTSITKITDATATGSSFFTQVSINDSGQVAYSFLDEISETTSTVGLGSGGRRWIFGPSPIVAGPGTMALGDFVSSAHIGRDSLNNLGQLVLEMEFLDRPPLIARADLVSPWTNVVATAGALAYALSTGAGSSGGMQTVVTLPPRLTVLDFDATFLTNKGELKVVLGDQVLKSIPASSRGLRQSFQVPMDLREKARRNGPVKSADLKFQITGAPGAVVHVANINIPGSHLSSSPADPVSRWHFEKKSGWASLVDDTPFPVEVKLLSEKPDQSGPAKQVSVAILSTKTFNPTKDIERETLHFAGSPVAHEADDKGGSRPRCSERDLNGDRVPDLVCEFESAAGKAVGSSAKTTLLQGMSLYGWMIEGRTE
jgi:hypothetical protein